MKVSFPKFVGTRVEGMRWARVLNLSAPLRATEKTTSGCRRVKFSSYPLTISALSAQS